MINWSQKLIIHVIDINKLLKKADCNTKILDFQKKIPVHDKYTNKLKKENFDKTLKKQI